ncbi:MAG: MBL fold metallo-hydrolase [Fimbriimonadales bacterium]|nr:MAG: MBL fold metallo-hydrolase [Fimbriimonadales bacterium]
MSVPLPSRIGPYELHLIEAGSFRLDGGAMFGVVPKPLWERKIPADERNRILLAMRCLLLTSADRTILVDVGIGGKFDSKFADIYGVDSSDSTLRDALASAGVQPEDVTDVVLTHLHFDHCGGATSWNGSDLVPTFLSATYHVQEEHWRWACDPNPRERASFLQENFLPVEAAGQLNRVQGGTVLFEGVETVVVNGHTRAMQLVKVADGGTTLLYAADLVPTAAHVPLPWIMAYDVEPLRTLEEKERILGQAADEGWILVLEHDPQHAAIRIERDGSSFRAVLE